MSQEELKNLKAKRSGVRGWVTRAVKELHELIAEEPPDKTSLVDGLETLSKRVGILEELQGDIEILLKIEDLADDQRETEEYFDKAKVVRRKAAKLVSELNAKEDDNDSQHGKHGQAGTGKHVKLPKLQLPKFAGDVTQFQEFWDQFEATVDKTDLPVVNKFTYLKNLLEGEAKATVEGLTLTGDHYETACKILKERYGRKELVVFSHIQSLLTLKPADHLKDNLSKLKNLMDQVNIHVRSLETLGIDGPTYGVMLTPVILSRLPADVRMEWAREGLNKEGDLNWLLTFLKGEIERRERANTFKLESAKKDPQNQDKKQSSKTKGKPKLSTASALHSSTQGNRQCAFCSKSNHKSSKCWTAAKLSNEDQRAAIRKAGLCFKCLEQGHLAKSCQAVCEKCKRGHHKLLCTSMLKAEEKVEKQKDEKQDDGAAGDSNVNVSCLAKTRKQQVILQTAKVKIRGPNGKIEQACILFDSGSDQSYVTASLAKKLQLSTVDKIEHRYATFGGKKSDRSQKDVKKVSLLDLSNNTHTINAIEIPVIYATLEKPSVPEDVLKKLNLVASEPQSTTMNIDMLIGLDFY